MLDGLPVLELADHRGQVGPWLLAELGAEVIRVVDPGRPCADHDGWFHDGRDLTAEAYGVGKNVISLDPRSNGDRATLRELVAGAAVVIDSGPPRRSAAYGIDRAKLVELNPRVVSVVVTPFGSDGPRAYQPASELTVAALAGPVRLQGTPERAPLHHSVPQVWRHAGAEAAAAALVALSRVEQTGQPQFVDVSAQAAMTWTMLNAMEAHAIQGADFERTGATLMLSMTTPLRQACVDGHVIVVARGSNGAMLVPWMVEDGIVDPSWADEDWDDFDRRVIDGEPTQVGLDDFVEAVAALCARYTKRELLERGREIGVTIAPVNDVADLLAFDHLEARGFWRHLVEPTDGTDGTAAPVGVSCQVDGPRVPGSFVTIDGVRPTPDRTRPQVAGGPVRFSAGSARRSPGDGERGSGHKHKHGHGHRPPHRSAPASDAGRPFDGLVVADFSWVGVGPITAKCLADHGATVVRVESARRIDGLRLQPPFCHAEPGINRSNFFGTFNTSKLGLTLDLKNDRGRAMALRLIEGSDVVIDSFTPGSMARLGLGPDDIRAANPSAVTVTTSLLASGGPHSTMAGYGYHAAALAGFFDLVGWPDLLPDGPWLAYTDTIAPRFLTTAVLAAIERRNRTGEGCHIEASQLECALQFLAPELLGHQLTGTIPGRRGNRADRLAPQGVYPCQGDDCWVAISVVDDQAWTRFRAALGNPGWARGAVLDTVQGRIRKHDAIDTAIAAWTSERTEAEVEDLLREAGVAAGRVQRSSDLLADPQYGHRGFYQHLAHREVGSVPYAGHQYRIEGYDHGPRSAAPCLGEHTFEVLTDLCGCDIDEIADLAAIGCLE